jgi:hypothetical protein
MNKNTLLKLILIVLLLSNFVVMCSIKSPFSNNSTSEIVDSFGVFGINQVRVNSGHEFELVLEDGRKVWAFLEITSSYKAKDELIKLFNSSTNPRCVLKEKKDSFWIVDIHVTDDMGKDTSVVDFLRNKGLVFKV